MSFPAASGCLTFPRQCLIDQVPEHVVGGHIPGCDLFLPWTFTDVISQFSIQFLVFTDPTRAPMKLRNLFVNPFWPRWLLSGQRKSMQKFLLCHSGSCFGFYQKILVLKIKKVTVCLEGQQLHHGISLFLPLSTSLWICEFSPVLVL